MKILGLIYILLLSTSTSASECKSSNITTCYKNYDNLLNVLKKRASKFAPVNKSDILEVWKLYGKNYDGGPLQVTFNGEQPEAVGVAICDSEKLANLNKYNPQMACYYIDIYKNDDDWFHGTGGRKIGHY